MSRLPKPPTVSGRQMRRGVAFTWPALLAGLWVLVAALEVLKRDDEAELRRLLGEVLGDPAQRDTS